MKFLVVPAAAGFALLGSHSLPLRAETTEFSGTICWTGDMQYVGTTAKDMGYVWTINWTYVVDGDNAALNSSGTCHGSGVIVDGTPEAFQYFCRHIAAEGATHMSRAEGGSASAIGVMFGGAGTMAGISGEWNAGEEVPIPVAEGKMAGCRPASANYTLPG